jgi:hypothetical protein
MRILPQPLQWMMYHRVKISTPLFCSILLFYALSSSHYYSLLPLTSPTARWPIRTAPATTKDPLHAPTHTHISCVRHSAPPRQIRTAPRNYKGSTTHTYTYSYIVCSTLFPHSIATHTLHGPQHIMTFEQHMPLHHQNNIIISQHPHRP